MTRPSDETAPQGVERLPLFESLPYAPGSATSREAAERTYLEAAIQRRKVLAAYRAAGDAGLTPDEAASLLGISVLACRPRCTELKDSGFLELAGQRRKNASGLSANVLRAVTKQVRE